MNELFNGCNPYTVAVVDHVKITVHTEFFKLKTMEGTPIDLRAFPRGDLFVNKYPELRSYVYPNFFEEKPRGVFVLEPEVLTCIKNGKFMVLAIGFYFGKDGTDF